MQLTDLTFKAVIMTIAVLILLIEIYNKIYTARKNHRSEIEEKERPVKNLEERLDQYDGYFVADKKRLETLEKRLKQNESENKIMLKMLLALTRHAIDGNNIEGLKSMRDEVQGYLIDK